MHPALSVIAFSTLSGAGYGLLLLLGLQAALAPAEPQRFIVPLLCATLLVTAGLLASTLHLGQPQRAWRAFSQWRSSWLSREGVAAVATYLPLFVLTWLAWLGNAGVATRLVGALLALGAVATVFCTARIYNSLPTVPAWRLPEVVPGYFGFALLCGSAWLGTLQALRGHDPHSAALLLLITAPLLGARKWRYWKQIDRMPDLPIASALGLPAGSQARSFEAPHTEANYICREMGFVLARRHRDPLRRIAVIAFAVVPALLALAALGSSAGQALWLAAAVVFTLLGAFVERWLFFAEARHIVATYYQR